MRHETMATSAATEITPAAVVFPLPLTPFEYYFLCEERPDFAGVIPIELEATGGLDRAHFERAFQLTHRRHPMLSARVVARGRDWPTWVEGEAEPICYVAPELSSDRLSSTSLTCARLHVDESAERIRFFFEFRHLAVDGLGAFQFITDLFVAYGHLCSGSEEPLPWRRVDAERLKDRDGHQLFNRRTSLTDLWRMARVHLPLSLRQAALVSEEHRVESNDKAAGPAEDFLVVELSEAETSSLSRVAARHSVMLNDLLVRDYFLMLAEWNAGTSQARRPLRVMIPTNMRRREDLRMSAANVFSYVFLTRSARACRDREKLLTSICDEMGAVKREKRGLYYEAALRWFCYWPWFLRWSLSREWAFATAVFTNLGTGFDHVPVRSENGRKVVGDLRFEKGAGAGPIRPGTRISFAAHSYAGRLAIGACCDRLSLNPALRQALLDAYIRQLRTTIELET